MKHIYNWLKKLIGVKAFSVSEVSFSFNNVVVGKILEIEKHPNADRLQIVRVDIGSVEPSLLTSLPEGERKIRKDILIVCGAPNIKVGQFVPVALVGAKLPGGMEIKEAEIRGVKSFGMLCAKDELGLSSDHSGIMILDENAVIGMEFAKYISLNK